MALDGIRIRSAEPADADAIARVQAATWQAAYLGMLPHEILAAFGQAQGGAFWERVLIKAPTELVLVAELERPDAGLRLRRPDPPAHPRLRRRVLCPLRAARGAGLRHRHRAGGARRPRAWFGSAGSALRSGCSRTTTSAGGSTSAWMAGRSASPRRSPIAAPPTPTSARWRMAGRTCAARPGWSTSRTDAERCGGAPPIRRVRLAAPGTAAGRRTGRLRAGAAAARAAASAHRRGWPGPRPPPVDAGDPASRLFCEALTGLLGAERDGLRRAARRGRSGGESWTGRRAVPGTERCVIEGDAWPRARYECAGAPVARRPSATAPPASSRC